MIQSQDRSGWFGASDVSYIMGNWITKAFKSWWLVKLGLDNRHFATKAMNAGTYYEHAILEHIGTPRMDHQILIPELRLRVNLDGDGPGQIHEVKTHKAEKVYKPTTAHFRQVNVQMFAKKRVEGVLPKAEIVSYGLLPEDYDNFFRPIDPSRVRRHPVSYNIAFIDNFLERLSYLRDCLERGVFP